MSKVFLHMVCHASWTFHFIFAKFPFFFFDGKQLWVQTDTKNDTKRYHGLYPLRHHLPTHMSLLLPHYYYYYYDDDHYYYYYYYYDDDDDYYYYCYDDNYYYYYYDDYYYYYYDYYYDYSSSS